MLSKEIKELIKISGGKLVISEGDIDKSYIVMGLKEYLAEKKSKTIEKVGKRDLLEEGAKREENMEDIGKSRIKNQLRNVLKRKEGWKEKDDLTKKTELDKIDAEIDEFYRTEKEKELNEMIKAEQEEYKYDYFSK